MIIIRTEKITASGSKNKRLRRKLKHYNHLLKNDLIPRKKLRSCQGNFC